MPEAALLPTRPTFTYPMHPTLALPVKTDFPALRRARLDTLQVNLGYRCNLTIKRPLAWAERFHRWERA
jgi:hypothetical protein